MVNDRLEKNKLLARRLSRLFEFVIRNKINLFVFFVIFGLIFYVFNFGFLAVDKHRTDLTGSNIECLKGGRNLYFYFSEKNTDFLTVKEFFNCTEVAEDLKNEKIVAYHSAKGSIHRLLVNDDVFFSVSPYMYVIPYSFLFFGLFVSVRMVISRKKSSC